MSRRVELCVESLLLGSQSIRSLISDPALVCWFPWGVPGTLPIFANSRALSSALLFLTVESLRLLCKSACSAVQVLWCDVVPLGLREDHSIMMPQNQGINRLLTMKKLDWSAEQRNMAALRHDRHSVKIDIV
jgi:hypothetical protein